MEKFLIIRFSSMGDILLTSPFVRILRRTFPYAQIDFLLKKEYADLLRHNPHVTSLIDLQSPDKTELKNLRSRVRSSKYDVIFDLHNSLRSRYVRTFAGARSTRVIRKRIIARFFLVNFKWNFYGNDRQSVAGRYIETGRTLGLADDDTGIEIFLPDEVVDRTAGLLKRLNLDRFRCVVGFAPGARHFTKRWPQERFVRLGGELSKNLNAKMLVFGDRSEEEYCGDIVQMINRDAGSAAAESLAGKLSILETAAAFDACNVIVSNDTGLMHLAAARKRKIVAIFGSTVGQFGFFPSYTENIVVERHGLPCRPCNHVGLDRCPKGHFRCMKDIEAAQVAEAVARILGETKG